MTRRRMLLGSYVCLFCILVLAPIVSITAGSFTDTTFVVFPPEGFSLRWYAQVFSQTNSMGALAFSLVLASASATAATLIALPIADGLRSGGTWSKALYAVAMTPAMLPAVFLGLAFLVMFSAMRITGSYAIFIGHVVMVLPFALSLITVGFASLNPSLELAARSLGAGKLQVMRSVTLPLIAWSLASGWGFAFMISFGALEVSLFLSSSRVVTLPVQIFTTLEWSPLDPALTAVSACVIVVTLGVLVATAKIVRLERFLQR
jgi:putative spermidine/putrescine transport system permease protein